MENLQAERHAETKEEVRADAELIQTTLHNIESRSLKVTLTVFRTV